MTAFSPDAAAALDGPDWLRSRRTAAAETFASRGLPTAEEEVWRYSRIDELDLEQHAPAPSPTAAPGVPADASSFIAPLGPVASVVTVDGRVARLDRGLLGEKVEIGDADEAALGSVAGDGPDSLAVLNDAFAPQPLLVRVPAGVTATAPIVIVHTTTGAHTTFPRLVVELGDDAEATIIEVQLSDAGAALVVPVTEISVGKAARATYVGIQQLALSTWQIGSLLARVDASASFRSVAAAFGGDYARLRTDCRLEGRGAHGDLDAIYFGEGSQMLDFRTFQEHRAPDTTSNLLFKGAVGGHSRSVYTGLIRVEKEARGTNAFQTNRNIKLSEHAWAESVPNLVIENNDVRCSHASTVGPVAEEERFYLESRGVPTDVAERLIVTGFFDEVLQHIPLEAVRPGLDLTIAAKFERREA